MRKSYILRLTSGTGNELFIYAFYRFLQIKYNLKVLLDIKSGINSKYGINPEGKKFTLDKFRTKIKIANDKNCYLGLLGKIRRFLDKSVFVRRSYIQEKNYKINLNKVINSKYTINYIEGYFQDLKFIDPIKNQLKNEIKLVKKNNYFENLKKKINFKNSICLTYRDFFKDDKSIFNKIDKILNYPNLRNKKIYIFTNNLKKLLKFTTNLRNRNFEEIIFNYDKHSIFALDLMTNFNTFVIGSSTFHWWGTYLAKKPKKIYLTNKIHKPIQTKEMKLIF